MINVLEQVQFGLKKEAVRGVAEAAPDRWLAINGDSALNYNQLLIDDETKRGIGAMFPATLGVKDGEGSIPFPVRASEIGEFLQMCIGDPVTTTPGGATLARLHTFTHTGLQNVERPSYTSFMDRGLGVKSYSLTSIDQLSFNQDPDGLMQMEGAMLFKTEAPSSIGTPDYTGESEEAEPDTITHKIDTVLDQEIRQFSYNMNNQMFKQRTHSQSKDVKNIIAVGPMILQGTFERFFDTEAERVKFLAGTQIEIDHDFDGSLIEAGQNFEIKLNVPTAKYTAHPFGHLDGILGASAEWTAEYDLVTNKLFSIAVKNGILTYP